jgi:prevent-host-death family protein
MVLMDTDRPATSSERVTVRDLQRHTSEVLEKVQEHGIIHITKHGKTIARILPPDPAEEQINALVAAGVLDPKALTETYTNGQMAAEFSAATRTSEGSSLTDAVLALREEEGER